MNRTLAILLLLTIAGAAFAQVSRPITQINDVTALDPYAELMEFWQGDTVQYDIYARDGRTAMQYTGDVFAVWMVAARTNYGTVYMISTGTVASATNGHLRINAARAQTLLPATNYWSQVRVFRIADAVTQELSVAAWNILTVRESIDVSASEYADPIPAPWTITVNITNNYGDVVGGNITNIVGGTNVTIRSGGGPQVTVDFDRTGIATGTPVYYVAYGTTTGTAYRGDWGLATSNTAFSAYLLSQDANTRSIAAGADATQALIRANAAGVLGTNNAEAIAGLGWNRIEPTILTAVDGTLTIPYTNSRTFAATLSGAATVTVDTASFTTNDIFSVRLDIDGSSLALTLPTSVVANAGYYSSTNVTINANGRTVLFLDKPWKGSFPCRIADF